MITPMVITAAAVTAAAEIAVIVALVVGSDRTPVEPSPQHDTDWQPKDFATMRAELFTDESGDVFAPAAPPAGGRHHHDTVEMVTQDYLIPGAYADRIAPRLRDARQAISE